MKVIVLKESFFYKKGQLIEGKKTKGGFVDGENFINESDFINEEITKDDEKKIKDIIKTQLELMFWRLYTKSSFLIN